MMKLNKHPSSHLMSRGSAVAFPSCHRATQGDNLEVGWTNNQMKLQLVI